MFALVVLSQRALPAIWRVRVLLAAALLRAALVRFVVDGEGPPKLLHEAAARHGEKCGCGKQTANQDESQAATAHPGASPFAPAPGTRPGASLHPE